MTEKYHISPEIPASKTERLQPKFLRKRTDNGTVGEMHVPNAPQGMPIRQTCQSGALFPDERGRFERIGLPPRFGKGR